MLLPLLHPWRHLLTNVILATGSGKVKGAQLCYNGDASITFQLISHKVNELLSTIQRSLPSHLFDLLQAIGEKASRLGMSLYLVGGPVRDLLLDAPIKDLDLAVEGDASVLAIESVKELGGEVVNYSEFGTGTIKLAGQRLDLVTARSERYSRPGALPKVTPGTIHDDLRRRDFTINTMAISLSEAGPGRGQLLDPHGGRADIERRLIRILHPASFVDDATRVLRAIRYERRLDFSLEDCTLGRLREAVQDRMLDTVSADRLRRELGHMLDEEHPHKPLHRAGELGVLAAIFPPLGDASTMEALASYDIGGETLGYLAGLAYPLTSDEGEDFIRRLNMPNRWARIVRDTVALKSKERVVEERGSSPSALFGVLENLVPVSVQAVSILTSSPAVKERLNFYLEKLCHVRPSLNGRDLVSLGATQGPMVGEMLRALRKARLEGKVATRQDEIRLAQKLLATKGG